MNVTIKNEPFSEPLGSNVSSLSCSCSAYRLVVVRSRIGFLAVYHYCEIVILLYLSLHGALELVLQSRIFRTLRSGLKGFDVTWITWRGVIQERFVRPRSLQERSDENLEQR